MQVREIMTSEPACCTPETDLQQIACLMVQNDCGAIPVVENETTMRVIGIVTDRDIVCRTLARGKDPIHLKAQDCMTIPVTTVKQDDPVEVCVQLMEQKDVRRIPVVDGNGCCCGMVSQADIACHCGEHQAAEVVRDISSAT